MALPSFCSDSVTVVRAPLRESRGTSTRDWSSATRKEIEGCSVQFGSTSTGRADERELAVSDAATLFAPPGADIEPGDRIECAFGAFEVDGSPMPRTSPTGAASHVECSLSRWRG